MKIFLFDRIYSVEVPDNYIIVGNDGSYSEIGNTEGSHYHRDRFSGLVANMTYYYRIRAYNVSGYSNYSNEISVTTLP